MRIKNQGGFLYVENVHNERTNHIKNLVMGQKKSKGKGSFSSKAVSLNYYLIINIVHIRYFEWFPA